MASVVSMRSYLLVTAIVCTFLFAHIIAQADDYQPEIGPLGKHPDKGDAGDKGADQGKGDGDAGPDKGDKAPEHGKEDDDADAGGGGGGGGGDDDKDPKVGVGDDPTNIVSEALLCFNDKHIYSKCEESYRLTEVGELHIPSEHIHEYCTGPCLEETNLVLHCLDGIMDHFLFYSKVTTKDVKDTILASCNHGGDLDLPEHIEADGAGESLGTKLTVQVLSVAVIIILGTIFLM